MFRWVLATALATMALLAAACGGSGKHSVSSLAVHSAAWHSGGRLEPPSACRQRGDHGRSPAVSWQRGPHGTEAYAVTVTDEDAGSFRHWVVLKIPNGVTSLPAGGPVPGRELDNGFGYSGYGAPCPPAGETHRYVLAVWALSGTVSSVDALAGNALARGSVTATYAR